MVTIQYVADKLKCSTEYVKKYMPEDTEPDSKLSMAEYIVKQFSNDMNYKDAKSKLPQVLARIDTLSVEYNGKYSVHHWCGYGLPLFGIIRKLFDEQKDATSYIHDRTTLFYACTANKPLQSHIYWLSNQIGMKSSRGDTALLILCKNKWLSYKHIKCIKLLADKEKDICNISNYSPIIQCLRANHDSEYLQEVVNMLWTGKINQWTVCNEIMYAYEFEQSFIIERYAKELSEKIDNMFNIHDTLCIMNNSILCVNRNYVVDNTGLIFDVQSHGFKNKTLVSDDVMDKYKDIACKLPNGVDNSKLDKDEIMRLYTLCNILRTYGNNLGANTSCLDNSISLLTVICSRYV